MASIGRPLSGRAAERKILRRLFDSKEAEFLAVYGRRRVGKTFLIRRFFQDYPISYFEMMGRFDGSQEAQLQIFGEALSSTFHRGAKLRAPANWHDAFQARKLALSPRDLVELYMIFGGVPHYLDGRRADPHGSLARGVRAAKLSLKPPSLPGLRAPPRWPR
jgi:uncharacterized protein